MARYVTIRPAFGASACEGDECPMLLAQTVYEADREPVKTGLLDETGTPLFRVEDRAPFGFFIGRK